LAAVSKEPEMVRKGLFHYVIYDKPSDHPDHFVVRKWSIRDGDLKPLDIVGVTLSLEAARDLIPVDRIDMPVFENDDPVIVEVWACDE
jgi:hypothetical protein